MMLKISALTLMMLFFCSCTPKTIDLQKNKQVYEVEYAIVQGDTVIFINKECDCFGCDKNDLLLSKVRKNK